MLLRQENNFFQQPAAHNVIGIIIINFHRSVCNGIAGRGRDLFAFYPLSY